MNELTVVNNPDIFVIGGLILNYKPLIALNQLKHKIHFIDINSFITPFDISIIVKLVEMQINSLNKPIILIGYSAGGLIAINIANNKPYLVYKLILINSTPCFLNKKNWHGITPQNFSRLITRLNTMSFIQFKNYFSQLSLYPKIHESKKLFKYQSSYCNYNTTKRWLEIIADTDLRLQLNAIIKQVLLVYSFEDHLIPNINYLTDTKFKQYTLTNSSHAQLEESQLVQYVGQFIV